MALLEVTQWGLNLMTDGKRWERPLAINPRAIMAISPAAGGCDIEMMLIRGEHEDYVFTYHVVEPYAMVMNRLREIGA